MKLTAVLLLTFSLHLSAKMDGQIVSISVKNASLETVIHEIEKQSGYSFIYGQDILMKSKPVTIDIKKTDLEKVLEIVFTNQLIDFKVSGKYIVLSLKTKVQGLNEILPPSIFVDIKGRVINEKGEPVGGVTVSIKGTNKATSTDANGEFVLKNVDPDAVLVFSGINTENFETKLQGRSELVINLKTKITLLDEMQVIAYGSTSRKFQTGSVSTVKAETIERQPVGNVLNALKGAVPGLDVVQRSGTPGVSVKFNIRGLNSLNGDNEPYILIDGVPMSVINFNNSFTAFGGYSAFNSINPNDIESIEVLKDADATAIYGSRGSNGVILITTKKGKAGKTEFNVNVQQGMGAVSTKTQMLTTRQYLDMRYEAYSNDNIDWKASNVSAPDLKLWDTTRYTNWQDVLIGGTAKYTNAQVSLSGGNAQTSFSFSGSYWKETDVHPGDFANNRLLGRFSFNHLSANERLRFSLTSLYGYNFNQYPTASVTQAYTLAPHAPALYSADGLLNWEGGSWSNPLAYLLMTSDAAIHNLNTSAQISYRILKKLWIKTDMGFGKIDNNVTALTPKASISPFASFIQSSGRFRNAKNATWNLEPYLEFEQKIWKGKLSALMGTTFQKTTGTTSSILGRNYTDDALLRNPSAAQLISINETNSLYKYNALFGRVNYNIMNRYILNLTGRRDGSSRFGPGRQFGNFGAVGLAWIFSEEEFIKKALPFLSFGKLRSSYGITGSDAIGDYNYLSTYSLSNIESPTTGNRGLRPARLSNPDYQWEANTKFDAAMDLGFNNDQILFSANYYNNRSSNQLVGIPMPAMVGFGALSGNLNATVKNTGWEFNLSLINVKTKNFEWRTTANLTLPKNELTDYPNLAQSTNANNYIIGQSVSVEQLYSFIGVNPQTGINVYRDRNGKDTSFMTSYLFTLADRVVMINMVPHYYGGLTNSFEYKGLTLEFMIQYSKRTRNNDIATLNGAVPGSPNNIPLYVYENSWRSPGDAALFQKFTQATNTPAYRSRTTSSSEAYFMDLQLLRLNNASLSWKLPKSWQEKLHAQSARVYVQAQNLLTISNYKGVDPEAGTTALPLLRVITAGVQISF